MLIGRRAFISSSGATLLLPGCVSGPRGSALPTVSLESLMRQLKHDVGSYVFEHQRDTAVKSSEKPCAGDVNFTIQKVKMTVTATFDRETGASGGLKVPIGLITLDASGSLSKTLTNTVTTSLTVFPLTADAGAVFSGDTEKYKYQELKAAPPAPSEFTGTPIRDALNGLRRDMIAASDTAPCFNFGQEGDPQDNVVKWGFAIKEVQGGGIGLSILLFSLGAQSSSTTTYANTLEASFIATGDGAG